MKLYANSSNYPPILKGKISDIYPWKFPFLDHLCFFNLYRKKTIIAKIKTKIKINNIYFLDSGRSALTLAIKSILNKKQKEVLISSFSCPAIINAVISAGGIPIFIDLDKKLGIEEKSLIKGLTNKTIALIVGNTYGLIDRLDKLENFCKKNKIFLINDLAQVPITNGQNIHCFGDILIHSFGPEKHFFSLDGGCLIINNQTLIKKIKKNLPTKSVSISKLIKTLISRYCYYFRFIKHKLLPKVFPFKKKHSSQDIKIPEKINPKLMSSIQLKNLLKKIKYEKKTYTQLISNFNYLNSLIKKISVFKPYSQYISPPLYFTLQIKNGKRYELAKLLDKNGICSVWNYFPLYKYEAYKQYKIISQKNTNLIWQEVLSIPFRENQTKQKIEKTATVINSFLI